MFDSGSGLLTVEGSEVLPNIDDNERVLPVRTKSLPINFISSSEPALKTLLTKAFAMITIKTFY